MPRKDLYHDTVKRALERDGWKITRENQMLVIGEARVFIDLSAELIVAERDKIKIAVEVKSFLAPSLISGFQDALGQYRLYRYFLKQQDPERRLVLAVPILVEQFLITQLGLDILEGEDLLVFIYDSQEEVIKQWLPKPIV
jgi:Holliday junction resolvase-like predicted endonuclease